MYLTCALSDCYYPYNLHFKGIFGALWHVLCWRAAKKHKQLYNKQKYWIPKLLSDVICIQYNFNHMAPDQLHPTFHRIM